MSLRRGASQLTHRGSHQSLLAPLGPSAGRSLDAIVVPAARPAENLLPAMVLAAETGAAFLALTSGATKPAAVRAVAAEVPGLQYAVVPVPADYEHWIVDFRTSTPIFRAAQVGRLGDLSLKRNLGVLLGRLAGWRSILFLDDDIRALCPAAVRRRPRPFPPPVRSVCPLPTSRTTPSCATRTASSGGHRTSSSADRRCSSISI